MLTLKTIADSALGNKFINDDKPVDVQNHHFPVRYISRRLQYNLQVAILCFCVYNSAADRVNRAEDYGVID